MSLSSAEVVFARIKSATKKSRIAVFKSVEPGALDAVFADTVHTRKALIGGLNLVGLFDSTMDQAKVYMDLKKGENEIPD